MRFARLRRLLGPLEPVVLRMYRWLRTRSAQQLQPAVVVVATDADHVEAAAQLAAERGDTVGFWVTGAEDVAPYATCGWFVVRLDPRAPVDETVGDRVRAIERHLRVVRVVDLRGR